MERIKQALEKAKREPADGGFVPNFRDAAAKSQPPGIEAVEYRQTRIVPLDCEHLRRQRIVAFNKNDPITGVFDVLRTKVLRRMEEHGWRTLAITSPTPEAGKTVVAINLAMSVAQQTNKTSMLVDFDLRRPRIAAYLGIPLEKSLNDVLDGRASLSEALVNPGVPRFVVLPTNAPVEKSSETLSSRKVLNLVQDLRGRYRDRIVIFDLPPLLDTDDTIAVLPQIDCVLLVIGSGMSSRAEIEDSIRHLPSANLVGVVLNKGEAEVRAYGY